jgi:hypothetical protein
MPDLKSLDFYPNHFEQFLSEFGTMHLPHPLAIFIQILD